MTDQDLRPPKQRSIGSSGSGATKWLLIVLALAALGYGGWTAREYWAAKNRATTPHVEQAQPAEPVAVPEEVLPLQPLADASLTKEPEPVTQQGPLHPLPSNQASEPAAGQSAPSLDELVVQWLGPQSLKFVVTPGLAHHIVATIDNLPRSHAAPRLWPLSPVGGKIELEEGLQGLQIASYNSARYDAVVDFVTDIEPAKAATWYRQAYPLLQQSYENLGYPGKYFNDRLVEVIDHLLLTPDPLGPIEVDLVQVQGQIEPQQPWLRYEFADEDLQKLSAGQKILLRLGRDHRVRLKVYLQELRAQVAAKP